MDHLLLAALVVLFISIVGVVALAPPLMGFALTAALAGAWCGWLEGES
jgi:hypothetical protein